MPWLCVWDAIYGITPPSKAWRPDDEEPVITAEGDKICQRCAKKWRDGHNQQQLENSKKKGSTK